MFETTKFKASSISQRLHETAYLNPELTITFINKRDDKEAIVYHEPEGIVGFIKDLNKEKEAITDVIRFTGERDNIQVDIAFQFTNTYEENMLGFCNNIYTEEGGTHLN